MTPDRFRACLAALHWSQHGLARVLGVDEREVRRWASGAHAVPERIAVWLETLARTHEANLPPTPPATPP
jgi:transcriptional regulator with XRE-family HTH domain